MQGGESTIEEMCLTFPVFYPRPADRRNLDFCISFPHVQPEISVNAFDPFVQKYILLVNHTCITIIICIAASARFLHNDILYIYLHRRNPQAAMLYQQGRAIESFNAIEWSPDAVQDLEKTILTGPTGAYCRSAATEV